ncbi:efflux transporter outer membrane subunit [Wohlfahrtiimonas chitiniclastica]|uniref:efflux transporter outer membrane subunit n=1 Tax=Wohlfahrtiimonas chitiniclastica TaxID=400946 RepID=UPI001BCDA023|nr:efflux transporter outer membrane subunit [Wohlfahrtiimonas chitiniclastica]MBS7816805.1 efflux transporter outer membrane subunit [Wohlfahrtiimonas chitiniclastica]MBS7822302.1 efflux transporter outer membrane subunit [Wohlfahrtiimonas chitiniclastica]MBS7830364.1 efflux transporter outer membrane subunit [Wohlfahrtiimonas chitiniclastica]MBS7832332.1 efflux transporter outer membrane subunit [Wohlfahrtiimonas chitiniclastica]
MKKLPLYLMLTAVLSACSLAPDYQRPPLPVANSFPGEPAKANEIKVKAAEIGWKQYFKDPRLQEYISAALANNRDLRIAMLNVEQARIAYGITISDRLPGINAQGGYSRAKNGDNPLTGRSNITEGYKIGGGISAFELDFFGKFASLSDAAQNQYLASVEGQKAAHIALVAQVARSYIQLKTAEEQLNLARETSRTYNASYQLVKQQVEAGIANDLDLAQSEAQLYSSKVAVASAERAVLQLNNALNLVVGKTITPHARGYAIGSQKILGKLPAGLPSEVLLSHPDVMAAEYQLMASNANIGAARAAFFPSISLTTTIGSMSEKFSDLFKAPGETWSFAPQISIPIFNWGKIKSNYDLSLVRKDVGIATYEKAIQTAFTNVANGLQSQKPLQRQLAAQVKLVATTKESLRLAQLLYDNGIASYLNVLDAQRSHFQARNGLLSTYQEQILNGISLYVALGGGLYEDTVSNTEPMFEEVK